MSDKKKNEISKKYSIEIIKKEYYVISILNDYGVNETKRFKSYDRACEFFEKIIKDESNIFKNLNNGSFKKDIRFEVKQLFAMPGCDENIDFDIENLVFEDDDPEKKTAKNKESQQEEFNEEFENNKHNNGQIRQSDVLV